jgi:flagellar protein FliO/FliZ
VAPADDKLSRKDAAHDAWAHGNDCPGRKLRVPALLRRTALSPAIATGLFPGALFAEAAQGGWPISGGAGMNAAYLAQMLMGLVLVVAAILVLAFFMRRVGGMQSRLGSEFRVLGGISLGSRERMLLVQVGEKQLVVGVAPGRVQTLHVLDEPIRTEGPVRGVDAQGDSPFARRLRSVLQRDQKS